MHISRQKHKENSTIYSKYMSPDLINNENNYFFHRFIISPKNSNKNYIQMLKNNKV